ncbi:MAG: glycoside hydrolase family 3 N-terminal domain-containing protein [Elusimicrobiota bacterium]
MPLTLAATLLTFLVPFASAAAPEKPLYKDPKAPVEARVKDLLGRMTLEEKVGQMTQLNFSAYNSDQNVAVDVVPEKLRKLVREDHVGSFLNGIAVPPAQWVRYGTELQKIALEESRLGIPIVYGIDHVHGADYVSGATIFPQNLSIACTFDDAFAAREGSVTALEAADLGHHWNFAPILDVGLNAYWSRLFETFGEEPLVVARMGSAFVRALQEEPKTAPYRMAATAKHFLGYSDPKSGWDRSPAQIPDQYLYEFFVPSFRAAIAAGVKTVMVNYGEINGVPVLSSHRHLTELLRGELGFKGVVLSDWDHITKLVKEHRVARDEKDAARMAVNAGMDMAMTPYTTDFSRNLVALVREGKVSAARIDEAAARVLRLKFELGLFEHPFPSADRLARVGAPEHKAAALAAAREALVLLENKKGVLPLSPKTRSILVAGPAADSKRHLGGAWTLGWLGRPEAEYPASMPTILAALKKEFPAAEVRLAPAAGAPGSPVRMAFRKAASAADVVVLALGEEPATEQEGLIEDLSMPDEQLDLAAAAAESGKPCVLVLVEARPRVISTITDRMGAVLFAGLPGFEGATAIAEVLSGKTNPSGKLAFSYPAAPGHVVAYHHKSSDRTTAQYPFGAGLSYTQFAYEGLKLDAERVGPAGKVRASVRVTNKGKRAGREAVLWYLSDEVARITRPVKRLKQYEKIALAPGESKEVSFLIDAQKDLSYPDEKGSPVLEDGDFTLRVGPLSAKLTFDSTKK